MIMLVIIMTISPFVQTIEFRDAQNCMMVRDELVANRVKQIESVTCIIDYPNEVSLK